MNDKQKCWICGNAADSREHVIKKTDLVRAYGKGSFSSASGPAHVKDGKISILQGPDSTRVKYQANLCQDCNGTFTQPFDSAYDRFVDWVFQNEESVLRSRFIDFQDVYGSDFDAPQRNLFKYFVKSFGCRLADAGKVVPLDLVTLPGQEQFSTALRVSFSVNEDILLMPTTMRNGFIGKGQLLAWKIDALVNAGVGYSFDEHLSWLFVHSWYGRASEPRTGSEWIANARVVYLGSITFWSAERRQEFLKKLQEETSSESATGEKPE
jgi:hypothetical protein